MDGLSEAFSEMKIDPKLSVGNLLTIAVLLFHLIFYSAKGINDSQASIIDVKRNSNKISQIELEQVGHSKDLTYIAKQLENIENMVTQIAKRK